MTNLNTNISHVEINVGDYRKSIQFYDIILKPLGWERFVCTKSHTVYCDGFMKLILGPVEEKYIKDGFHRKRIGLNHLAFYAQTKSAVDTFYNDVLKTNGIPSLYQSGADGDNEYYSVLFEDPDRMKIEVVYAPHYSKRECWPNNIVSDFDPYSED
jgi:catechol 2,3-dioxygenase-like lactoylglutathione lyase family enzyme